MGHTRCTTWQQWLPWGVDLESFCLGHEVWSGDCTKLRTLQGTGKQERRTFVFLVRVVNLCLSKGDQHLAFSKSETNAGIKMRSVRALEPGNEHRVRSAKVQGQDERPEKRALRHNMLNLPLVSSISASKVAQFAAKGT